MQYLHLSLLLGIFFLAACKNRNIDRSGEFLKAQEQNRKIIGEAVDFRAEEYDFLRARQDFLYRRQIAWNTIRKVSEPVAITNPSTGLQTNIPLWQTWYDIREFELIFEIFVASLSPEEFAAVPVSDEKIAAAFTAFHTRDLKSYWTRIEANGLSRFEGLLGQLSSPEDLRGLNGGPTGGALFNRSLITHYLKYFRSVLDCHEAAENSRVFKPCFHQDFPLDAASVKASYVAAGNKVAMPSDFLPYLSRALSENAWPKDKLMASPNAQNAYTANLRDDNELSPQVSTYHLMGLHVITKELPQWLWATLWWSESAQVDFGSDNPFDGNHLFSHYKMCMAADYDEKDKVEQQPWKKIQELLAPHVQGSTWCSNRFIELDPGMVRTNCIGCHQFAGPGRVQKKELRQKVVVSEGRFLWSLGGDHRGDSFAKVMQKVIAEKEENSR